MHSTLAVAVEAPSPPKMQHARTQDDQPTTRPSPSASTTPRPLLQSDSTHRITSPTPRSPLKSKAPSSQLSTSNAADSALSNPQDAELTPPSDFSSQEYAFQDPPRSPGGLQSRQRPISAAPALTPLSVESPILGEFSSDLLSGQKRTASGQMKRSSISSVQDLRQEGRTPGSSRPSSMLLNGSNGGVAELSQQLRTRLSYAMVKVQNGWQSQTLDEVESLASHQPSPRSSIFDFPTSSNRNSLQSPKTVMTATLQRQWSSSESSDSHSPQSVTTPVTQRVGTNGTHNHPSTQTQFSSRALAPPVDIIPGSRRRPTPNGPKNGHHDLGGPATPQRHISTQGASKQRTPSQNAAMEADAVETLLFMASPINSGYHPSSSSGGALESSTRSTTQMASQLSSQTSPLQSSSRFNNDNNLSSPRRGVSFADRERARLNRRSRPLAVVMSAQDKDTIERMLDESDDDSSSDGLDEALSLVANSRQTKRRSLHA